MKKILTVFGTRPEILKLAPLVRLLDSRFCHVLVHTGQHFSPNMSRIFFKELRLRAPDYNLNLHSVPELQQFGQMLDKLGFIIKKENPDLVLVQGDTNSGLAGALAAKKLAKKVGHIEAGCRCFDKSRPEELNRILIDQLSDVLFAPSKGQAQNLLAEGIPKKNIVVSGNTSADSIRASAPLSKKSEILETLGLRPRAFSVVTLHRAETVDSAARLAEIVSALNEIAEKTTLVFPLHPRTGKRLKEFNLSLSKKIIQTSPMGSQDFSRLLLDSRMVLTDSGGVQEEAAFFDVPAVVLADFTEWTQFVLAGKNFLGGTKKSGIVRLAQKFLASDRFWNASRKGKIAVPRFPSKKIVSELKKRI